MQEGAKSAGDKTKDTAGDSYDKAGDMGKSAGDKAKSTTDDVKPYALWSCRYSSPVANQPSGRKRSSG